jgi:hypothetical protein
MKPTTKKLRSKALAGGELDKVYGGMPAGGMLCKGTACGAMLHCPRCGWTWPATGGVNCVMCLRGESN